MWPIRAIKTGIKARNKTKKRRESRKLIGRGDHQAYSYGVRTNVTFPSLSTFQMVGPSWWTDRNAEPQKEIVDLFLSIPFECLCALWGPVCVGSPIGLCVFLITKF